MRATKWRYKTVGAFPRRQRAALLTRHAVGIYGQAMGRYQADVVELVDARDSKSGSERSAGSIPAARTIHDRRL